MFLRKKMAFVKSIDSFYRTETKINCCIIIKYYVENQSVVLAFQLNHINY